MGKSVKDHVKRTKKLARREEKALGRRRGMSDDDDDIDEDDNPSDWSAPASRKGSNFPSRVASRTASPFSRDRVPPKIDDLYIRNHLRLPLRSGCTSVHASRVPTPDESDLEADQSTSLDLLDGNELLRRMSQILSSKTSIRGADHKMKKASGRGSKKKRQESPSTYSQKEDILSRLCRFLREDVFSANIEDDQIHELHRSILVSIKQPGSPAERDLALQALAMVAVTLGANERFLSNIGLLKEMIGNETNEGTKALAIYALTAVVCFGDSGQDHWDLLLEYLLTIIQTDGSSVNARDSAAVVCAAMEAWAFVATGCELHEHSVEAMDAFIEQLESVDLNVQALAASNIALLFDISRQLRTIAITEANPGQEPDATKMLELYEDPRRLADKIRTLSKEHNTMRSRHNKVDKKEQLDFAAVTLELDVGYGYSTRAEPGPRQAYWYQGYLETIKLGDRKIVVKSWAIWAKVQFLQSILAAGFVHHVADNDKVLSFLNEAPIVGLLEDWDHEEQETRFETDIRQYWETSNCSPD